MLRKLLIAALGTSSLIAVLAGCGTRPQAQQAFEERRDELFGVVGQLAALTPHATWSGQWAKPFSCVPDDGAQESFAIWVTGTISEPGELDRDRLAEEFRDVLENAGWSPQLHERPFREGTFPEVTSEQALNAAAAEGEFGFVISFLDDPDSGTVPDPTAVRFSLVSPCVEGGYRAVLTVLEDSAAPWGARSGGTGS